MTASEPALTQGFRRLGERALGGLEELGSFGLLVGQLGRASLRRGFPWRDCLQQFERVVVRSTTIVSLTALFTGMVLALQTVTSLTRFGAKPYTGSFVGLAYVLELGPVLTALMVAGRVGAGIAAEIGSMQVTEQVDAMRAMGADPVQKLVLPRVLASIVGVPLLTVLAIWIGIFGGLVIGWQYGITPNFYLQSVVNIVQVEDLLRGLSKTFIFGFLVASVACHRGLRTQGGTVGVGQATTRAVVVSSISVLVADFFLTKLLLVMK